MTRRPTSPTRCSPSVCGQAKPAPICRPYASRCRRRARRTRRRQGPARRGQAPFGLKALTSHYDLRHGRRHAAAVSQVQRRPRRGRVDAAGLRRAVPATEGNTRRLATLGPALQDLEARHRRTVRCHARPRRGCHRAARRVANRLPDYGWLHPGPRRAAAGARHGRPRLPHRRATWWYANMCHHGRATRPTSSGRPAASTAFVELRWPCVVVARNLYRRGRSRTPSEGSRRGSSHRASSIYGWLPRSTCGAATSWFLDPGPFRRDAVERLCVGPTPSPWSPKAAEQTHNPLDTPVCRGFLPYLLHESLPGVDAVLCELHALFDKQLGGIGGLLADRGDFGALGRVSSPTQTPPGACGRAGGRSIRTR